MERYGDHFHTAVRDMAEAAGLPFHPHPDTVPNTRRALELSEWARTQAPDAHERLHDRLMDAYWREGRDIGAWDELAACVTDVGLDAAEAERAVASRRFAEPVDAWTGWAQARGIDAIPAFVFEERVLVSGAVPHEVLERAARRAQKLRGEEARAEEG